MLEPLFNRASYLGIIALLAIFSSCNQAFSAETFFTGTLPVENRSPVIQLYALSRPEYHLPQQEGQNSWHLRLDIANYLSFEQKDNQSIFIDGETWIVSNTFQHQLSKHSILHVMIPWVRQSGGFADRSIYSFHEVFSLPQNGRTRNRNDLLNWKLRANGQDLVSLNEQVQDLGDTVIKFSWTPENQNHIQINTHLKLPTGNFEKQTGSEKFDAGISILGLNPEWLENRNWLSDQALSFWYGTGLSYLGQPGKLNGFDPRHWALTVRTGMAWAISPNWRVKIQMDSNSPVFESEIRELGWIPIQIGFATEHNIASDITFDFMMVEDLRPRVTPDIIFSTGINILF